MHSIKTKLLAISIIASSLAAPVTSYADDGLKGAMNICLSLSNDNARLSCYDKLAKKGGSSVSKVKQPIIKEDKPSSVINRKKSKPVASTTGSGWVYQETTDSTSGLTIHSLGTESVSGVSRFNKKFVLFLRCRDGKADVLVSWHDFMGSKPTEVTFQVGDNAAKTQMWNTSTDKKETFALNPEALIESFDGEQQVVFQATPWNKKTGQHTAVFSLEGFEEKSAKFRAACSL